MRLLIFAASMLLAAGPAASQSRETEVTAHNGVVISVWADDFANRYEFAAPVIHSGDGFVIVSRTDDGGAIGSVSVIGGMVYSGDWRIYNRAVFRGGVDAAFVERGREVGRCRAGGGCTLTESFAVAVTAAEIQSHGRDGVLEIQVRARSGEGETVFAIPLAHFDAVREVASRPREGLVPAPYNKSMGPPAGP